MIGMEPRYLHLRPEAPPPDLAPCPFRAILVADEAVNETWMHRIAEWVIERGCLYFVAWGIGCEAWHNSVDWAVLEAFDFGDIPDDRFVMTTWHNNEPLSEAMWFAGHCASHPDVELSDTIILHISTEERASHLLQIYSESQTTTGESNG